eukprot:gb/GFBE01013587.1/.p1 GENE.gb/GFBE01013587.1/~~gb/GFBE01013587.1/.p1  ORF type:complete len:166 (+),score=37.88 gb/GFBE01013587.1/:2-499(+)
MEARAQTFAAEAPDQPLFSRDAIKLVRARVLHGMAAGQDSAERNVMLMVFAAWRTALSTRRTVGSLQAALFAEEADRASALRAQRSECDVLLLQAEARHRISMQKLRTELAEAQAKVSSQAAAERISALQAAMRSETSSARYDEPAEDDTSTDDPSSPGPDSSDA